MALWEGRFKKDLDIRTNDFNSSIKFDFRMYKQDIEGSIAHTKMLAKQNIIKKTEANLIIQELNNICNEIENDNLKIDFKAEDIHMFIETELTKRLKDIGKKLHTARSRNDQVSLDLRMYLKSQIDVIVNLIKELINSLINKAQDNLETVMPGYTHLQRAQAVTFAHYLMAYVEMLLRDIDRLNDTYKRTNILPLGNCALAGTTYNIDREYVNNLLGFDNITHNSLDGVSDRDFVIELASDISIIMMHLSRFSEEIIMWCSWEFNFIELDDSFSTGSSIMPQKKNPDICELIRGKTARTYGNLNTLLTMMKGLPLAYNKDMQEDKEAIFDSIDTLKICFSTLIPMIDTFTVNKENMKKAASNGFINATDCADYLVSECDLYQDILNKEYNKDITTIYWCRDSKAQRINKKLDDNKLELVYIGSINNIIDIDEICRIIKNIDKDVVVHVIGDGESKDEFLLRLRKICEVIYHGVITEEETKENIFCKCHAGINIYKKGLYIGLTVKCIDYFEHGLPIINNIVSDTWKLVDAYNVGFNVEENSELNVQDIIEMAKDNQHIYKLFDDFFSKKVFIKKCNDIIDEVES